LNFKLKPGYNSMEKNGSCGIISIRLPPETTKIKPSLYYEMFGVGPRRYTVE
jgi:hypothetical protein